MGRVDWRMVATWAPVVAVAALSQTGLGLESPWTGSDAALALTSALLAAPLLVRGTRPLVTAALTAIALVVQVELGGSLHFASFVAVLVAAYSGGRHAAARTGAAGAVVLLAGVAASMRGSLAQDAHELVFPLFYLTAATVLGAVVRRQARHAAELRRLNDALVREREALDRLVVATERLRLARELHDVVAHTLTVVVIQAEVCEEAIGDDPDRARAAARQVQEAGRRGLADLRSLVRVLRDADAGAGEPGLGDLDALGGAMAGAGLDVEVVRDGDLQGLPPGLEGELYRIVQEALTNVVKHSAAPSVRVLLRRGGRHVALEVTDPGPAASTPGPSGGHGLAGMAERLAPFGGEVSAGPAGGGFRVHVSVPVRQEVLA
ncbi:MAG TPA: sensor histidine kinase [Marmoricola sp.]|nr:sensor histidine kinase [Marmoricola sp.]